MHKIESWIATMSISRPLLSLLTSLILLVLPISGLKFMQFDADPAVYFSDDHKHFRLFKSLEDTYGRVDSVMMIINATDGNLFTAKNLQLIEDITDDAWTLPYATRVDSLSNYNYSWSQDDELNVEPLIDNAASYSPERISEIKAIALSDPDIVKRLVSPEQPMAMVHIIASLPKIDRHKEEAEMAAAVEKMTAHIEAMHPDIEILLSGNVISNTVITDIAAEDVVTIIPLMYLVIFVMLGILLRSITAVFCIFIITVTACLAAMGLAAWLGMVINMMSITSINIIVTVSIAHCVHILVYFLQSYHRGNNKKDALAESLKINLMPISLTSLTTALGFLSMNLSKMPPAHDLGNITAMGVFLAFILSLFLLPPLLLLLPVKKRKQKDGVRLNNFMAPFAEFVISHRTALLGLSLVGSLALLAFAPMNVMNDRFTENIKLPNQFREDNAVLDQFFGGLYTIEYDFKAKEPGGIADPDYLASMDRFVSWLRQQPGVKNVRAYSDIMKRLNQNMHNDDPAFYRIPETREAAAQYQLLFEMSQPMGFDMTHLVRADKSATRLIVSLPSTDTDDLIALQQEAHEWVKQNMPEYMVYSGEGIAVMWAYLGQETIIDGLKGALLALLLISVILMLVFKSFKYGLISLIPNLLPAGMGYGIWAIINGELSMGQMMVLSLTIGIVVDDTVHFLGKYLRAKRDLQVTTQDAIRFAFTQVGPALWITTIVLIAGFGMLTLSDFIPNINLGMLTVFIISAALMLDFFLLPPLLMLVDQDKQTAKSSTAPQKHLNS